MTIQKRWEVQNELKHKAWQTGFTLTLFMCKASPIEINIKWKIVANQWAKKISPNTYKATTTGNKCLKGTKMSRRVREIGKTRGGRKRRRRYLKTTPA